MSHHSSSETANPSRCRRALAQRSVAVLAGLASSIVAGTALADAPPALIWYSINNGPTVTGSIVGQLNPNGNALYSATIQDPSGAWKITYTIVGDFSNDPLSSVSGLIACTNSTDGTIGFRCGIEVPICPSLNNGSAIGGVGKITLISDGPGAITCDGGPVVEMITDGATATPVFYCPFSLVNSGSGISATHSVFGLPGPSQGGPRKAETIGAAQRFKLTSGDTATVQVTFMMKDIDGVPIPVCAADLNGDGEVGLQDLQLLKAAWGNTSSCPSDLPQDLNGNGVVDAPDLMYLLQSWGPCQN